MKKTKIILLTIGILLLLSSICFAQTPELAWDDIFEKFIGTYDNGSLDTDGAILTDKVPRIIVTCLIVGSAGMLAFGELSATTTTFLRMILSMTVIINLGIYFGYMFIVPDSSFISIAEPKPDPNSANFLGQMMMSFIYKCQKGAEFLYPICVKILACAWAIDVAITLMLKIEDDIIKYMISNALKMAMYLFLITNWILGMGIAHAVFASFERIGYIAGGGENSILMPDDIMGNAFKIIENTWNSFSQISFTTSPFALILAVVIFLVIVACILVISAQIMVVRVEFWVMAIFTMLTMSIGMFKPTKFLFERAISSLIHYATKVSIVAFVTAILEPMLTSAVENFVSGGESLDLQKNFLTFMQLAFSLGIMCMLVYKLPNLAQAISSGQPALNGNDLSNQLKAMPTKAMRMKGAWDVASRMPGGNSARGAAGFLSNMKSIGMQAGRGDLKGAGKTALNYGKGTLGTAKNLAQMGIQNGLLDSYYKAQKEAHNAQSQTAMMKRLKKAGKLENNTSANTLENEKTTAYRERLQRTFSPKDSYEYERERAYKEKQDQLNGKSVSTEHMTPFMYTSLSNHNNDHDNHNNNYNNNNHHDDYYNDDDNVND